jgi:hypothetical protein
MTITKKKETKKRQQILARRCGENTDGRNANYYSPYGN